MGKGRCWFSWVKKIFASEAKPKTEKKSRRLRWIFGRLKLKQYLAALPAPQKSLSEATEEQRKHALNVAIATAAAAEAAVAAAQAAAEVVRLAAASKPFHYFTTMEKDRAAIKIQCAFRAHLARKALRALKGVVKLQAIVRGQAVRREVLKNLKCLQSGTKTYAQVKEKTTSGSTTKLIFYDSCSCRGNHKNESRDKDIMHDCNSEKSWIDSVLSKEDIEAIWLRRQEAVTKRERMLKYSYSHRERPNSRLLDEALHFKETGRSSFVEAEGANKRERVMILKQNQNIISNWEEVHGPSHSHSHSHVRFRNLQRQEEDTIFDGLNSPFSFPRRSFCRVAGDEGSGSIPNSPVVFPTYMAATQSAKAKARSMSTPRQRVGFLDTLDYSHSASYKGGLSCWSSTFNGQPLSFNEKKAGAMAVFP